MVGGNLILIRFMNKMFGDRQNKQEFDQLFITLPLVGIILLIIR